MNRSFPNNIPIQRHSPEPTFPTPHEPTQKPSLPNIPLSQAIRHRQRTETQVHRPPLHQSQQPTRPFPRPVPSARPSTKKQSRTASLVPSHPLRPHNQTNRIIQPNNLRDRITKPPPHRHRPSHPSSSTNPHSNLKHNHKVQARAHPHPYRKSKYRSAANANDRPTSPPPINWPHMQTLWSYRHHEHRRWIAKALKEHRISSDVAKQLNGYFGRVKFGPRKTDLAKEALDVLGFMQDDPSGTGKDSVWAERMNREGRMGKWGVRVIKDLKEVEVGWDEWIANKEHWEKVFAERRRRDRTRLRKVRDYRRAEGGNEGVVEVKVGTGNGGDDRGDGDGEEEEDWLVGEDDLESNWEELLGDEENDAGGYAMEED